MFGVLSRKTEPVHLLSRPLVECIQKVTLTLRTNGLLQLSLTQRAPSSPVQSPLSVSLRLLPVVLHSLVSLFHSNAWTFWRMSISIPTMYAHTNEHVCTHTHTHTCAHTHTHTKHTHACSHAYWHIHTPSVCPKNGWCNNLFTHGHNHHTRKTMIACDENTLRTAGIHPHHKTKA